MIPNIDLKNDVHYLEISYHKQGWVGQSLKFLNRISMGGQETRVGSGMGGWREIGVKTEGVRREVGEWVEACRRQRVMERGVETEGVREVWGVGMEAEREVGSE